MQKVLLLADEYLQKQIQAEAPKLWHRIQSRRNYIKNELGIQLSPDVLPMTSTVAYLRPLLFEKGKAMKVNLQ